MTDNTPPYRLIVTSGPTREWLDPVRFLSNPASGQTGWHLASHAASSRYNHFFSEVIYICGPVQPPYDQVKNCLNIHIDSTQEMCTAVHDYIRDHSILLMSAAPADYCSKHISEHKIKKTSSPQALQLKLVPTVDILKSLIPIAHKFSHFYRVGFAAETQNLIEYAKIKLNEKQLSMICANRVYKDKTGFGDTRNALSIIDKQGNIQNCGPAPKEDIANFLLQQIIHQFIRKNNQIASA